MAAAVLLYVLSVGPAIAFSLRYDRTRWLAGAYLPITFCLEHITPLKEPMTRYINFWIVLVN